MAEHDGQQYGEDGPTDWWDGSDVEIEAVGGIKVAYLPEADDAWISGWVEVPR